MPKVQLNLDPVGRGCLVVDGERLSNITSGVSIISEAGEPTKVMVDLGVCSLDDLVIDGAELSIKGDRIPESVQRALYEFLHGKYDHLEVTVLADESRKFAFRPK